MKKIIAASALALTAIAAAPAMAQDASIPFDGPYVAVLGGYDKIRVDTPVGAGSDDGFLYGGVVGFDKNINGLVLGLEGEATGSTTKEGVNDLFVAGDRATVKPGRDLYAGVRLGGEITPGVLLYAKGGYTNARVKVSYDDGVDVLRDSTNLDGYRLGAGIETNISGFLARVEYRFSDYGNPKGFGLKPDRHQVAAMVGYRF
ncbi:outer membrane protein [uncultured Novosphingobium sp.]|uniref:outer membrane protein n=1 Tax=uncultured Novosphingobium sp. TaxID=292277 RepID=UPI003747B25B